METNKIKKSPVTIDDHLLNDIKDLIEHKSTNALSDILNGMFPEDIASVINGLSESEGAILFGMLPAGTASEVLKDLDNSRLQTLFNPSNITEMSKILTSLPSNSAARIVSLLDDQIESKLLESLPEDKARNISELLKYWEKEAGSIMRKEFIIMNENDDVQDCLRKIGNQITGSQGSDCILITDGSNRLTGILKYKDLLNAYERPATKLGSIMNTDVISLRDNADVKDAVNLIQRYRLLSIPVVDETGAPAGIILSEDLTEHMHREFSKRIAMLTGTKNISLENASPLELLKSRLWWILMILGAEIISAIVISFYNELIWKVLLFAFLFPLISSLSGVSGVQSAYYVSMHGSRGVIKSQVYRQIVKSTVQSGLLIGLICGFVVFLLTAYWSGNIIMGLMIAFSLLVSVNICGAIGLYIPVFYNRIGIDPLSSANHFHAAVYDVISILIFLSIAALSIKLIL